MTSFNNMIRKSLFLKITIPAICTLLLIFFIVGTTIAAFEMLESTSEQKISAVEMVKSVSNINELTQTNASGAGEIAVTSEQIAGMADALQNKIGLFKIGEKGKSI